MDGVVALEVAIGLSFMFFLLSVIASGLGEWISRIFTVRASTLRQGLRALVAGDDRTSRESQKFLQDLMDQPGVRSLANNITPIGQNETGLFRFFKRTSGPSSVPASRFVASITDIALSDSPDMDAQAAMQRFTTNNGHMTELPTALRNQVQSIARGVNREIGEAGARFAEFRSRMERWYDESMDRVSGWYKRKLQLVLFAIGLVMAVGLNINVVTVATELWQDDEKRALVAAEAAAAQAGSTVDEPVGEFLRELPLPIGWTDSTEDPRIPDSNGGWVFHVIGWIVTAAAVSFGAPFWFDLMNRFVDLRGGGKDSEAEKKKKGKDQPPPSITVNVDRAQPDASGGG